MWVDFKPLTLYSCIVVPFEMLMSVSDILNHLVSVGCGTGCSNSTHTSRKVKVLENPTLL